MCFGVDDGEPTGTALGCTMRVKEGAVPNEHGTWLYGRGGWCDGLQVSPWRTDVTKQVSPLTPNVIIASTITLNLHWSFWPKLRTIAWSCFL